VSNNLLERWAVGVVSLAVMAALGLSLSMTPTGKYKPRTRVLTRLQPQVTCQHFQESGRSICGTFLDYWNSHGGLAQQGYPISNEMFDRSDTDGKTYTVQYFERAVFEKHPENRAPNDVLLQLLGVFAYEERYPDGAPDQIPNKVDGAQFFDATGKYVGGKFLEYWQRNGGLAQQGYPISEEFMEMSAMDGQMYKVQYFERAVMEYHPGNQPPYDVLLSQLGTFRHKERFGSGAESR
jgi:hypothetical protein